MTAAAIHDPLVPVPQPRRLLRGLRIARLLDRLTTRRWT
ncbi:hypothetical protein SAMN05216241_1196 [Limimonas halophila]|uniref:Uncharacterized protein n=1 Tax=Limimonas halophila TaxID=1082479 RepID=A0A1G7V0S7_9PROT|nr:hypothetical protein SAMN05216241_1196 [Limimonas halophila]